MKEVKINHAEMFGPVRESVGKLALLLDNPDARPLDFFEARKDFLAKFVEEKFRKYYSNLGSSLVMLGEPSTTALMGAISRGVHALATAISSERVNSEEVLYGTSSIYSSLASLQMNAELYEGKGL
ncbi:hypothetical protein KA107_00095 [Candidatus Pacearchaeota archaeon]|nr:hypothetical protein [Candidatus Pacearchaeota archaeon]